jgi:hypothetical protein
VNAIELELLAAIGAAFPASAASSAKNVRVNRALVTNAEPVRIHRQFSYLSRELVSEYSRIRVDWMSSGKGVKITATDAYSPHTDDRFTGLR